MVCWYNCILKQENQRDQNSKFFLFNFYPSHPRTHWRMHTHTGINTHTHTQTLPYCTFAQKITSFLMVNSRSLAPHIPPDITWTHRDNHQSAELIWTAYVWSSPSHPISDLSTSIAVSSAVRTGNYHRCAIVAVTTRTRREAGARGLQRPQFKSCAMKSLLLLLVFFGIVGVQSQKSRMLPGESIIFQINK